VTSSAIDKKLEIYKKYLENKLEIYSNFKLENLEGFLSMVDELNIR